MAVKTSWAAGDVLLAADLTDTFAAKAPLASPALTGTPTAPTAAAGTSTTQIATTAFVAGAGGLVLVTPSSIANSGGSASASGGQVTFSGVTSVSLNGIFTSNYENYEVIVYNTSTGTGFTAARLRAAGTDTTSGYVFQTSVATGTSLAAGRNTLGYWGLTSNRTSGLAFARATILRPQLAQTKGYVTAGSDPDAGAYYYAASGSCSSTSAHDGLTIYDSSGAAITGTIRVYGYKNS